MPTRLDRTLPYVLLMLLFVAAVALRPLLPIDETRYMTAAWEMYLQKQYFVLSINFEPYHHKPPVLFWLINIAWELFGVSRWAGLIPIFLTSCGFMALTQILCAELLPHNNKAQGFIPWLVLGSVPFLIYGTLVMFDMMVAAWLLAVLCALFRYVRKPSLLSMALAGLFLGLGVLTKGPVMYLYALWPLALYFWWRPEGCLGPRRFYKALGVALLISLLPVLLWVVPVILSTDNKFAFWLVWNQTAGRVTGNFSSAHVHPFYFYLPLVPVLLLPWAFVPAFWKNLRQISHKDKAVRFLIAASVPVFLSFSAIAGKQPHYLLPLLPFILIGMAVLLSECNPRNIKTISVAMVILIILGQGIASQAVFPRYDLGPTARFYQDHRDADWAFAPNYQGEMGFMGRVERPLANISKKQLGPWFSDHPGGYAIVRYDTPADVSAYQELYTMPYKGKWIGIYTGKGSK